MQIVRRVITDEGDYSVRVTPAPDQQAITDPDEIRLYLNRVRLLPALYDGGVEWHGRLRAFDILEVSRGDWSHVVLDVNALPAKLDIG